MTDDTAPESFGSLVSDLWTRQGYDVVPGDDVDLVADRDGETRLLETYPEGRVTAADVDEAVSRLIESARANHVTLVVADEVSPSLREQTEGWDVSLVDETDLRGMADSRDVNAFLGGSPDPPADPSGGVSDERVELTVQRQERRTLLRETGALLLEVLLVVLLVVVLGYLLVQVVALVPVQPIVL